MNIILLSGAPGSGKSTQGSALMRMNPNFKHLSLGDVVRSVLKDPTHPITTAYKELISSGSLLPDEVIFEILKTELAKITDKNTVVLLDGYPRTEAQYARFKAQWGAPSGLVHLDVDDGVLNARLRSRDSSRTDDNDKAIAKRLAFYKDTTKPLLERIKAELKDTAITAGSHASIEETSVYLYAKLQHIKSVHEALSTPPSTPVPAVEINPTIVDIGAYSAFSHLWSTGDEYLAIREIQRAHKIQNFSFNVLGKRVVYLETPAEVTAVLEAHSSLGKVYRLFSAAAGLKYDFVATDAHESSSYRLADGSVNIWRLIHSGFGSAVKEDKSRIERLMDKHLDLTFFAEKTFDLDTTFDTFFGSFWSEYLFGNRVPFATYKETKDLVLEVMKHSFYSNRLKGLDPTGLTSWVYSFGVKDKLALAKIKIREFIESSTADSFVQRFKSAIEQQNVRESLGLDAATIADIVADNVFDFFFEPDFLENVMYETLAVAIRDHADLHDPVVRSQVYTAGLKQAYLFPVRSRVIDERMVLPNGNEIPAGSMVYVNLKQAGVYHSAGARRCVGQAYTHYFREHLFKRLESIDFKVKDVTRPAERETLAHDESVPGTAERYRVSWRLKRDEAMRYLPYHDYHGTKFFDVLSLHENPGLNTHMVNQLALKIRRYLEKNSIDLNDVVIATPEVRGIPIAAQVADHLHLPLYTIRKKGGYKMAADDVYTESYDKGYGDPDVVELPKIKVHALAGKKVIFLDDGLASGKSALACIKLLETRRAADKEPAKVGMVLSLLKHDYVQADPKLSEHRLVKTLFDCRGGPMPTLVPESASGLRI